MANPFSEFAYYAGRVLLTAFVAWYSINPHVTENQGHEFALFVSKHFKDVYFKNGTILSALELSNPVDPTTLFQGIFYGSEHSKYYEIYNLAADTTYVQLFEEKGQVDCTYHPVSCAIYDDLILLKKDFPITRDLFDAQWNSNYELINDKLYLQEEQTPKAKKVLINKDLDIKNIQDYKTYGFSKIGSNVHIISASENFTLTSVSEQPLYSQESNIGPENGQAFPYYLENESEFYPYNTDVYNISSRIKIENSSYEIGDMWFTNQQQIERGGYSASYKGMWIYSMLNEGNIAENLTEFTACLANSSYIDCVHQHLPWYHDCPPESSIKEKKMCYFINRTLSKIQKKTKILKKVNNTTTSNKNPSKQFLINSYIMIGLGGICIILCIVGIIVLKERKEKKIENQNLLNYTN